MKRSVCAHRPDGEERFPPYHRRPPPSTSRASWRPKRGEKPLVGHRCWHACAATLSPSCEKPPRPAARFRNDLRYMRPNRMEKSNVKTRPEVVLAFRYDVYTLGESSRRRLVFLEEFRQRRSMRRTKAAKASLYSLRDGFKCTNPSEGTLY